jgi:molybdate transport system regulatory protein
MQRPISRSARARWTPRLKFWLEVDGRYAFGLGIAEILRAVDRAGSIKRAAADVRKSYRHVWSRIKEAERVLGRPLVSTRVGGHAVSRSTLTVSGRRLAEEFFDVRSRLVELMQREFASRRHRSP